MQPSAVRGHVGWALRAQQLNEPQLLLDQRKRDLVLGISLANSGLAEDAVARLPLPDEAPARFHRWLTGSLLGVSRREGVLHSNLTWVTQTSDWRALTSLASVGRPSTHRRAPAPQP